MKTKIFLKRILSVALCMVLLLSQVSCQRTSDSAETFTEDSRCSEEWEKYTFMVDTFSFNAYNEKKGKTETRSASRLIKVDNETGDISHVCIDPVCSHEPYSDCPLVSTSSVTCLDHAVGDWLLFCVGDNVASGQSVNLYNLKTGEIRRNIAIKDENGQLSYRTFNGTIFFVGPDLEGGNTVYKFKSYSPETDKWKTLATFDSYYTILSVTNKRIYFVDMSVTSAYSDMVSFSLDYNGTDRRDEPVMKMAVSVKDGEICYGSAYRDLKISEDVSSRVFAGYYLKYNLNTKETSRIPADEGASVLGLWNGKLVYATCDNIEEGVSINTYEYALENGLDPRDISVRKYVNSRRNEIFFGGSMFIKICDLNGENSEIMYEYPGIFFDSGSVAGDYMTVETSQIDSETGAQTTRKARINLNTGEIEDVPVYTLGDIERTLVE